MKINEYLLKLSTKPIIVNKPIPLDQDLIITIRGECTEYRDISNQDGTFNRVYTLKGIIVED